MKKIISQLNTQTSILIIFSVIIHILVLKNVFFISKDMIYGDSSSVNISSRPLYGYMRIPISILAKKYYAENRLAADFAQIYFPSKNFSSLSTTYQDGYLDPWGRPSRYAPLLHFICSITLCKLNYGIASFLHMVIQILIFYFVLFVSFRLLSIEKNFLFGLTLANICMFLTPAGLSWFERGQFSIYVSVSYILIILGLNKSNLLLVILSALFAFIKWTSLPFILVILSVYILNSNTFSEIKKHISYSVIFFLVILSLSLCFPENSYYFFIGLMKQEKDLSPAGVSLLFYLPREVVKLSPIILILLGYVYGKINQNIAYWMVPFLLGAAVFLLMYPTKAYEYNIPSLLCFIPFIIHWEKSSINIINSSVVNIAKYLFYLFLCYSLINSVLNINPMNEYLLTAIIFLTFPLIPLMFIKIRHLKENIIGYK